MNDFQKKSSVSIKRIRASGHEKCPSCADGYIYPDGEKETATSFYCDRCGYAIHEERAIPDWKRLLTV